MAAESTTMTPKALAEELGIDPKRLRGWLRKEHSRAAEAHNTTWAISADVVEAARARFGKTEGDEAEA